MKREPKILIQDNTIFLTMDLKGLDLYQRGKVIRRFVNSDTRIVEDYADRLCKIILSKYGINVKDTSESAYKEALDRFKALGKELKVVDFYEDTKLDNCEIVQRSKNKITVLIEEERYLQCAVEIREEIDYVPSNIDEH